MERQRRTSSFAVDTPEGPRVLDASETNRLGPLVGRGFDCEVYAWGDARIVKLFDSSTQASRVNEQFRIANAVCAAGLKAPAASEILQIDDRLGIVYERIEGRSLFDEVQSKPWTLFAAARRMADLHARIHEAKAPSDWPTWKHRMGRKIEANASLTERDRR